MFFTLMTKDPPIHHVKRKNLTRLSIKNFSGENMKHFYLTIFLILTALIFVPVLRAEDPVYQKQINFQYKVRGGIGNTFAKLKTGQEVRVAYLGGSITCANGYRVMTTEWLSRQWPNAKITEIFAGVSGTGCQLGNYRLEHDVLLFKPDLLFIEFAVNDGGQSARSIWQNLEGIILKTWALNPKTDIVFIYTFCVPFAQSLEKGLLPDSASAMEQLAEYYNIPSINFMDRVFKMYKDKKLIFKSNKPAPENVLVFSKDGTHPGTEGHKLYLKDIQRAFAAMKDLTPADHLEKINKTFCSGTVVDGKMIPITETMLKGNWKKMSDKDRFAGFRDRLDEIWISEQPGDTLSFKFKGSEFGLYDVVGPNAGELLVTLDGKTDPKPLPRYDSYCINYYSTRITSRIIASDLDSEKIHTVKLEIAPGKPIRKHLADKSMVDPAELDKPKYQGNIIRIGKILIRGELVQ